MLGGLYDAQRDRGVDEVLALHLDGRDVDEDEADAVLALDAGALLGVQGGAEHLGLGARELGDALDLGVVRVDHPHPASLLRPGDLHELIVDGVVERHHARRPLFRKIPLFLL